MQRQTPSSRPTLRTLLTGIAGVALLFGPAPTLAQVGSDWCRDARQADHCEVRELTLETRNGELEVSAQPNGGIRVEGWDGSEVRVEARVTTRVRGWGDPEELAAEVEVVAAPGRLSSEGPRTRGRTSWEVSYRIRVPVGTNLDLITTNGAIHVAGVQGVVEARTTNGSIRLQDLTGAVRAQSTNGGVEASFSQGARLQSDTELRTTNGSVTLSIPEGSSARLEASTTNGGITTDFPITVQGRVGRSLSGTLGDGGPEIRIRTTNGAIRIRRS